MLPTGTANCLEDLPRATRASSTTEPLPLPPSLERRLRDSARRIQPLTPAVRELIELADDESVAMSDIMKPLQADAVLAAKLIKLANSSFYGLSRKISTIQDAAVLLGVQGVRNLAVSISLASSPDRSPWPESIVRPSDLNNHSLAVAIASRNLARILRVESVDKLFLAGLIHDLGKMVLAAAFPAEYPCLLEQAANEQKDPAVLEREEFGIDHTEVLRAIGGDWRLPDSLLDVATRHHQPSDDLVDQDAPNLTVILQAANTLAKLAGLGNSGNSHTDIAPLCHVMSYGCSVERLIAQSLSLADDLADFRSVLRLPASPLMRRNEQTNLQDVLLRHLLSCNQGSCPTRKS